MKVLRQWLFPIAILSLCLRFIHWLAFSAWSSPRTWSAGELVTASLFNTHLRDQLNALKAPPTDYYNVDEASNYTTTSTSFTDVDATDLALSITTTGGDILVMFSGSYNVNNTIGRLFLEIDLDGSAQATNDGALAYYGNGITNIDGAILPISFQRWLFGVSAGAHVIKLQWKVSSGHTATLYAGAGTSNADIHPQFSAREVS